MNTTVYLQTKIDVLAAQCDALSAPSGLPMTPRALLERHELLKQLIGEKSDWENLLTSYKVALEMVGKCQGIEFVRAKTQIEAIEEMIRDDAR